MDFEAHLEQLCPSDGLLPLDFATWKLAELASAMRFNRRKLRVLELGVGAGGFLVAWLHNSRAVVDPSLPIELAGIDIDLNAVTSADRNIRETAKSLGYTNVTVDITREDWSDDSAWRKSPLDAAWDLVYFNPPFKPIGEATPKLLHPAPDRALYSGKDGLDAFRVVIPRVAGLVGDSGTLIVRVSSAWNHRSQGFAAVELFSKIWPRWSMTLHAVEAVGSSVIRQGTAFSVNGSSRPRDRQPQWSRSVDCPASKDCGW